jgi:hypothetical protein
MPPLSDDDLAKLQGLEDAMNVQHTKNVYRFLTDYLSDDPESAKTILKALSYIWQLPLAQMTGEARLLHREVLEMLVGKYDTPEEVESALEAHQQGRGYTGTGVLPLFFREG